MRSALAVQGYDVCLFGDGRSAIASEKIMEADVLLIHYALPDMNGVAAFEALKDRGLGCTAIIVSSNVLVRCRTETARAGAEVVEKSVMAEALNDILRNRVARL